MKRRVAITGIGVVSPFGVGWQALADALCRNASAIAPITLFETTDAHATLGAQVPDFDLADLLESKQAYLDRSSRFALGATAMAVLDSGLHREQLGTCGISLGTAFGSTETAGVFFEGLLEKGPRLVKPFLFQHTYMNTAIGLSAIEFGLRGPHLNTAGSYTSGIDAIVAAHDTIALGQCDRMLAGGHDALNEYIHAGLDDAGELTPIKEYTPVSGPFGAEREGYIPAEGATIVMLEALDTALERGARVYAEIAGIGMSGELDDDVSRGVANAIRKAAPELTAIDAILASANGSYECDEAEATGIAAAFAAQPPGVSCVKGLTGDALSAGSSMLAAVGALALSDARVLPALDPDSCDHALPRCPLPPRQDVRTVLVNALDPGGNCVCLQLAKPGDGVCPPN